MIKALLRCLRLERLFERWLGMRGGDFEGRIYEALWVGCVLGFAAGAPKALEDLPGKEILQRLNGVFEALDRGPPAHCERAGTGPCVRRRGCRASVRTQRLSTPASATSGGRLARFARPDWATQPPLLPSP